MQTNLCHVQQELDAKSHHIRYEDAVALQKSRWDERPAGLEGTTSTPPDPHARTIIQDLRTDLGCHTEHQADAPSAAVAAVAAMAASGV